MIEDDPPKTTGTNDAPALMTTEQVTPDERRSLQHAPRANLDAVTRGKHASALVTSLSDALTAWEQSCGKRKNVRRKGLENLKGAIGAFVADLLHARNHPDANGWVYRPLAKSSFTKQAVSARDFTSVRDAWLACGLLDYKPGYTETVEFDPGDRIRTRGKAARFRATPKMLKLCAEHGVTPQNAGEHFTYPPPKNPVILTRAIMACTRFRRHRVRCFDGAGGGSWRDESLPASSKRVVVSFSTPSPTSQEGLLHCLKEKAKAD